VYLCVLLLFHLRLHRLLLPLLYSYPELLSPYHPPPPLPAFSTPQKRKAKVLAAAGSAAVEDLMKTTMKKDEELKALERQQAEFQASVSNDIQDATRDFQAFSEKCCEKFTNVARLKIK